MPVDEIFQGGQENFCKGGEPTFSEGVNKIRKFLRG